MLYPVIIQAKIAFQTSPATVPNDSSSMLGWFVGFIVALSVLALVARPLLVTSEGSLRRRVRQEQVQEKAKLEYLQERAAAERKSLEELEFDHELGNLDEADYTVLKEKSQSELARLESEIKQYKLTPDEVEPPAEVKVAARTAPKEAASVEKKAPAVTTTTARANTRTARLAELEARLKPSVKEAMKCSECANPFKPGDRFCSKCGAPLPHLCLNCGNELKDDERFCSKCGAAVND
jgi:predicted nucleic acid-binding Zn ribbon protein